MAWLHDAAGTSVNEKSGYGWKGWWYWSVRNGECTDLMNEVESTHIWRLFEGRRKKIGGGGGGG